MIDDGRFSTTPQRGEYQFKIGSRIRPHLAYDMGGPAIQNPEGGLLQFLWTAEYRDGAVWLSREGVEPVKLFDRPGIEVISLTFDAAMNPCIAFSTETTAHLWYYDSVATEHVFMDINGRTPFVALDERRPELSPYADVILTYLRGDKVYQRAQRDRYTIEYDHQPAGIVLSNTSRITAFAITKGSRMQWRVRP